MAKGKKTGGRQKGSSNKRTEKLAARVAETAAKIEESLPGAFDGDSHAFLMTVYKDPMNPLDVRIDAAKAAINFEKPRLQATQHSGDKDNPLAIAGQLFGMLDGATRGLHSRATRDDSDDVRRPKMAS